MNRILWRRQQNQHATLVTFFSDGAEDKNFQGSWPKEPQGLGLTAGGGIFIVHSWVSLCSHISVNDFSFFICYGQNLVNCCAGSENPKYSAVWGVVVF